MGNRCPKCQFDNPPDALYCGKCATPLPSSKEIPVTETIETPVEELTRGTTFAGRYEIIEELGKGGMGKVYRVLDKKLNEEVALKLIKAEIASCKKTIERFSNELKYARKIVHKNVGRMYHFSEEKGTHYITMEYVSGEDLKSFIRRAAPLSIGKSISIAQQVAEGLEEAHRLGVVHRDLKPQNIMIDKDGNARIMDFGIARSLKVKGITGAGVMIGTPEYISPEQAETKEVDQRSDIYSLGVILYEMLTGRVPFEGETPLCVAMKHKSEIPTDPMKLNSQIPENLSRLILRCMEKEKEKRYQSAEEVLDELTKIKKGFPTTEKVLTEKKPITSRETEVKFTLKKFFIPALVFIGIIIIGVIIWRFVPRIPLSSAVSFNKEDYFITGNKFWESKNYSEAINQFKKILATESTNFKAQLSIANVLKEQGKIDEAIPEYEKAITLNNLDPRPYKHLGKIFEGKQEFEKTVYYYRKYLETAPKSSDLKIFNRKIKDLEAQLHPSVEEKKEIAKPFKVVKKREKEPRIKPSDKPLTKKIEPRIESRVGPTELEKEKIDIPSTFDLGIKAFNNEDFDQCIELMEKVLELDPNNDRAKRYYNLANLKIAPAQIAAVVSQYIQSMNNDNLLIFYKNTCSSKLYMKIKKDIEMISDLYRNIQSEASNITVRFKEIDQAEVSFSHTITGASKKDSINQVLFEGIFKWDMEKQEGKWEIVDLSYHPAENK